MKQEPNRQKMCLRPVLCLASTASGRTSPLHCLVDSPSQQVMEVNEEGLWRTVQMWWRKQNFLLTISALRRLGTPKKHFTILHSFVIFG